jgi:cyclophilin family peptidyl-prolyl cis-trans isomerase
MKAKLSLMPILFILISSAWQCSSSEPKSTKSSNPVVLIETEYGNIKLILYNETPEHRDNFLKLIEEGFYEDLLFHRVIRNFMIQGGDPNSRTAAAGERLGSGGPDYTLPAEIHPDLFHKKGALAAARMGDNVNPEKRSSGSQFYIVQGTVFTDSQLQENENRINNMKLQNYYFKFLEEEKEKAFEKDETVNMDVLSKTAQERAEETSRAGERFVFPDNHKEIYKTLGGTPHLDGSYTVFGEVFEGIEVIDKIADQPTDQSSRPIKDIRMKIKILNK